MKNNPPKFPRYIPDESGLAGQALKHQNYWRFGAFSPGFESRFIGEGRHVYSTPMNQ